MSFLTKQEQAIIKYVQQAQNIPEAQRKAIVKTLKYNARLRQDGFRVGVRVFFQALSKHEAGKIEKSIKNKL